MKRHLFGFSFLIVSLLLTGCLTVFEPVDTPTPAPTAISLPTLAPTEPASVEPAATTSQSAPMCTVDPLITACASPKVDERDKYCSEKLPYTQYASAPGVTFEAVDPGLKCADQGLRNGEQVIACTGQPLTSYTLKVCNTSCASNTILKADASKCPTGYGYSADAGCCWPMPAPDAGCTLVTVNISACK